MRTNHHLKTGARKAGSPQSTSRICLYTLPSGVPLPLSYRYLAGHFLMQCKNKKSIYVNKTLVWPPVRKNSVSFGSLSPQEAWKVPLPQTPPNLRKKQMCQVKWLRKMGCPRPRQRMGGGQNSRYPASIFVSNKSKQAFLQKPKGRENRAASATPADLQENFFGNLKKRLIRHKFENKLNIRFRRPLYNNYWRQVTGRRTSEEAYKRF